MFSEVKKENKQEIFRSKTVIRNYSGSICIKVGNYTCSNRSSKDGVFAMKEMKEEVTRSFTSTGNSNREESMRSRVSGSCMKQPVFDWNMKYVYIELKPFKMEGAHIFLTRHYELNDLQKVPIIKHC